MSIRIAPSDFALDGPLLEEKWTRTRRGLGSPFRLWPIGFVAKRALLLRSPVPPFLVLGVVAAVFYILTAPLQRFKEWDYVLTDDAVARFWLAFMGVIVLGGVLLNLVLNAGYWTTSIFMITASWIANVAWATSNLPPDTVKTNAALLVVLPWYGVVVAQLVLIIALGIWIVMSASQDFVASGRLLSEFAALRLLDVLVLRDIIDRASKVSQLLWVRETLRAASSYLAAELERSREPDTAKCKSGEENLRCLDQEATRRFRKRWRVNTSARLRRTRAIEDVARATQLGIPAHFNAGDQETNRLVSEMRMLRANEIRALKLLLVTPTEATEQELQRRTVQLLHGIVAGNEPQFAQRSPSTRQHQFPPVLRHVLLIAIAVFALYATGRVGADGAGGDLPFPGGGTAAALTLVIPYVAVLVMTIIDPLAASRLSAMRYFGGS
ncbi:hypothetical protein [Longimicrobium sp.]|uniref:hypothetical protein n=1 Tax=Longimicrobium sp. TaxID=2029185 RepID=UPI002ED8CDBA